LGAAVNYQDFLKSKLLTSEPSGFDINRGDLPGNLYDYQKDLVTWAIRRGKAALFTMTGTGKTAMQVTWGEMIHQYHGGNVLILAPLAVAHQTVREAAKFGIQVTYCRQQSDMRPGVNITNYEMLSHFTPEGITGIALDESSILKSYSGKIRNHIIEFSRVIPYRLACTATPAPNDYMELGNHAEFLGVMSYTEMLATFFVHDGGDTSKWRLKGHAESAFWKWLASWGCFLTKPSDLGYSDDGFILPPLHTHQHVVESGPTEGALFTFEAKGLQERQQARRESISRRIERAAEIVAVSRRPFLIWCDLNAESEGLCKAIPGAVEITGSNSDEWKEQKMMEFAAGNIDVMVTKPKIAGFGMNWQSCADTAFVGLSDSFEAIFQATKRFHRHGQTQEVNRHLIISEAEGAVLANVQRKESEFMAMIESMVEHTKSIMQENVRSLTHQKIEYRPERKIIIPSWLNAEGF
jgi:superfamily II DNA or RNA helicase